MQHRAATEATRKDGSRAEKRPSRGDPHQGEKNPAGGIAPSGIELLKQGLKHGPAEDKHIDDQHSASPPQYTR